MRKAMIVCLNTWGFTFEELEWYWFRKRRFRIIL